MVSEDGAKKEIIDSQRINSIIDVEITPAPTALGKNPGYLIFPVCGCILQSTIDKEWSERKTGGNVNHVFFRATGLPVKDGSLAPTTADTRFVFIIENSIFREITPTFGVENPLTRQAESQASTSTTIEQNLTLQELDIAPRGPHSTTSAPTE